ncbi:transglycosylase domain-containing protein [Chitinispirillales bacterium ANBcel5]|uniref:transglycosylase domain-containing protein n=1 Tax=Cellulosispirillum alkaliphilum TaxID=3039283 RepID=UPI002A57437E|nr:transglycosylase domain-containing protein [Chitinispirillales bacterium ANBcel5]
MPDQKANDTIKQKNDSAVVPSYSQEDKKSTQKKSSLLRKLLQFTLFFFIAVAILTLAGSLLLFYYETQTHHFSANYLSEKASDFNYELTEGANYHIIYPQRGPLNKRRGYNRLPEFLNRLSAHQYTIEYQATLSPSMLNYIERGYNVPYREKSQAGLTITDNDGREFFSSLHPSPVYHSFDSVPKLILNTLLFIEDRNLLDTAVLHRNPAIDWRRFIGSTIHFGLSRVGLSNNLSGASTLATQLEKFCYSPGGMTTGPQEKVRQMVSASFRAYMGGRNTLDAREDIAVKYLNKVPFGAYRGYGEVNGLGEGLKIWYGTTLDSVNLSLGESAKFPQHRGRFYRMVLSLFISQRRPAYYLRPESESSLNSIVDSYLGLLHRKNIINTELYHDARNAQISINDPNEHPYVKHRPINKSANVIRTALMSKLSVPGLYDLDRFDMSVQSTILSNSTNQVEHLFNNLNRVSFLDSSGLRGHRLLNRGDPDSVVYSFSLYKRVGDQNILRIQTDNLNKPLNVNEGIKLDLGSTAKLRTVVSYLQIIEELYLKHRFKSTNELVTSLFENNDQLTTWVLLYLLLHTEEPTLETVLEAAMQKRYSASPDEVFFTGNGLHTFSNFDDKHNDQIISVKNAFRHSVNLPFIRLMRDIVDYHIHQIQRNDLMNSDSNQVRTKYLDKFVEFESQIFVRRFFNQLSSVSPDSLLNTLVQSTGINARRIAAVYCYLFSNPTKEELSELLNTYGIEVEDYSKSKSLINTFNAETMSLSDRGYISGIHPLKIWTAAHLLQNPNASLQSAYKASKPDLKDVYRWLYTADTAAQNSRIRTVLEMEAFKQIHQSWRKLGYPFPNLVPSYATSLGSSADNPLALAQLAGIIQSGGKKYPTQRIKQIHFAKDTPYEAILSKNTNQDNSKRVLSEPVAATLKELLFDVVENGTAMRVRNMFGPSSTVRIGGKTGTGDHRHRTVNHMGVVVNEEVRNRTAAFVFVIGDNHFGVITAMVKGEKAKDYSFTSSLTAQLLRMLEPVLSEVL